MNVIIGKRSNLSRTLYGNISDAVIISSDDFEQTIACCMQDNVKKFNIIFNNFQSSVDLYSDTNYGTYI